MNNKRGLSIASMVLGIISVVLFWTAIIGFPCGVLAIVFGAIGKKRNHNDKFANAGLILGIIHLILIISLFFIIFISYAILIMNRIALY